MKHFFCYVSSHPTFTFTSNEDNTIPPKLTSNSLLAYIFSTIKSSPSTPYIIAVLSYSYFLYEQYNQQREFPSVWESSPSALSIPHYSKPLSSFKILQSEHLEFLEIPISFYTHSESTSSDSSSISIVGSSIGTSIELI